jgi:hypothetical protein
MLHTEVCFFSVCYGITAYTEILGATGKHGRARSILIWRNIHGIPYQQLNKRI